MNAGNLIHGYSAAPTRPGSGIQVPACQNRPPPRRPGQIRPWHVDRMPIVNKRYLTLRHGRRPKLSASPFTAWTPSFYGMDAVPFDGMDAVLLRHVLRQFPKASFLGGFAGGNKTAGRRKQKKRGPPIWTGNLRLAGAECTHEAPVDGQPLQLSQGPLLLAATEIPCQAAHIHPIGPERVLAFKPAGDLTTANLPAAAPGRDVPGCRECTLSSAR